MYRSHDERRTFRRRMRVRHGRQSVILARTLQGRRFWAGLTDKRFHSAHGWVTGATGSGKSYFVLGALMQVLRRPEASVILLDMKGELSALLLDTIIPSLTTMPRGKEIVEKVRVIRPFGKYLPLLRITRQEEGVPREIQAETLARSLEQALGSDLGGRMRRIMLPLASLAIERDEPLTILKTWLEQPMTFVRAARLSANPMVRAYAATITGRENQSSLQALLARIDSFVFLESTRQALAAPACLSFAEALEDGVTILDLDPPAGAERVGQFWAGLLLGKLSRAILSRPVTLASKPCWVVLEEAQEALAGNGAHEVGRLLALARSRKVAIWSIHQQASQVQAASPDLLRLLQTNTRLQVAFRSNVKDAKAFVAGLPEAQEARHGQTLVADLCQLPNREFFLWTRDSGYGVQRLRSPRIPMEALAERTRSVTDEIREAIRRGMAAIPRPTSPVLEMDNAHHDEDEIPIWEPSLFPRLG